MHILGTETTSLARLLYYTRKRAEGPGEVMHPASQVSQGLSVCLSISSVLCPAGSCSILPTAPVIIFHLALPW